MRKWLVLASYDEHGQRQQSLDEASLDVLAIFTSGDGDEPMEGDLAAAIGERVGVDERLEVLLVSLDAAKSIGVVVEPKISVQWTGNFV